MSDQTTYITPDDFIRASDTNLDTFKTLQISLLLALTGAPTHTATCCSNLYRQITTASDELSKILRTQKNKGKKRLTEVCGPGSIVLRMHPEGLLPPILLTWTPALQHTGNSPVRQTERRGGERDREVVMDEKGRHEELCII